jgi:hypothetical protein
MSNENQNLFSRKVAGSLYEQRESFLDRLMKTMVQKDKWAGRGKALPARTLVEWSNLGDVVSLAQYLDSIGSKILRVTFEVDGHTLAGEVAGSLAQIKSELEEKKPNPMVELLEAQEKAQKAQMEQMMAMMAMMMGNQTPVVPPATPVAVETSVEAPAVEATPTVDAK